MTAEQEKQNRKYVWMISAVVLALVSVMNRVHFDVPWNLKFLPAVHAVLNTCVALCLLTAVYFVRKKNIPAHKTMMNLALCFSIAFLLCYVTYHFTNGETKFGGTGWIRPVYFFLLITHILSAAVSLPFILLTWLAGMSDQRARHRRLARKVFPLWLYVAVTGPVCYLLLRPYYL